MQNNKKAKRSRRRLATQIMCLFLCLLMVGGVFISILPIGGDHDHEHTDSEFDGGLTIEDILGSIETDENSGTNESTNKDTTNSTTSTDDKTE